MSRPGSTSRTGGRVTIVALAVCAGALATATASPGGPAPARTDRDARPPVLGHPLPSDAAGVTSAQGPTTTSSALPRRVRKVHFFKCREAEGGRCGTTRVPLDRKHPRRRKVRLYFEYFHHRAKGPSRGAIVVTEGGPGYSVTQTQFEDFFYRQSLDPLLEHRDLILLDQRGVGRSSVIDCKRLEHNSDFNAPGLLSRVRSCAKHLGASSSLYGSGDVALDLNTLRKRLGIKKLDLYGGSYAGQDVQSYAARFPRHTRSAVVDTPVVNLIINRPGSQFDEWGTDLAHQGPRGVEILCEQSRSCTAELGGPRDELRWLIDRVRQSPVTGTGFDADGRSRQVRITEGYLGWNLLLTGDFSFVAESEIPAAATALRNGDEVPLLRLGAEASGTVGSDPARIFSDGENSARYCTDAHFPWRKSSSIPDRKRQFERATNMLDDDHFGLFSNDGWLDPRTSPLNPDACIVWPHPRHHVAPSMPKHRRLSADVPALVLGADLDQSVPPQDVRPLRRLWPNSKYVELSPAAHHTYFSRQDCAPKLTIHFIRTLKVGDTSCADGHDTISFPGRGSFPETAAAATPARTRSGDASTLTDRKVATVATAAVTDGFRRSFGPSSTGSGPGLRGGTFAISFGDSAATLDLSSARFAEDVAVSGSADYGYESQAIDGTVTVNGPGAEDGTLHIEGVWFGFGPPTTALKIDGTLGGRNVSLSVPAS